MNITTAANAPAPAPAQKAGTPPSARAQGDTDQDAAAGASFLSMLQALGKPAAEPTQAVTPDPVGLGTGDADADAAAAADEARTALTWVLPMASTAVDAAMPTAQGEHASALVASRAGLLRPAPGQDAAAQLDADDGANGQLAASDAAASADTAGRKPGLLSRADSDMAQQLVHATAEAADDAAVADRARAEAQSVARESDGSRQRPLATAQTGASAAPVVSMFEAGLVGLRAGTGARSGERGHSRLAPADATAGFVAWTDGAPAGGTAHAASPVYAPTASTPVPAAALAQKMHFWVAGGVQSAELQLDAFDGGAVDVRIAVKGDEAMVEFRSDQPQARKLLLEAMPQLKELLAGEGLVLSGGFVGSSAQQHADGRGGQSERASAVRRPAGGREVQAPGPVAASVARTSPGAAVDLFV